MNLTRLVKKGFTLTALSSFFICQLALATPEGAQVSAGSATVTQSGTTTTINQASQNAVINWTSFNTAQSESVQFNQPNSSSIALNKINSGLPTTFNGSLSANGHVWIINPNGVLFGATSQVNVSGLLVTTHNITDSNFMSGHYQFDAVPGYENSKVINNGSITVQDTGMVALVAPGVENNGIITANLGQVYLRSGSSFVLDLYGDQLINFQASPVVQNGYVSNSGKITANGGKVYMTANSAAQAVQEVVSMSGVIEAITTSTGQHGEIILNGGDAGVTRVSGKIKAPKGHVETSGHVLIVEPTAEIVAGNWLIDPADLTISTGANTNVSGSSPYQPIAAVSVLNVTTLQSALASGNVTVQTNNDGFAGSGNITVANPVTWSSGNTLTLQAFNNIIVNAALNGGATGSVNLNAGGSITGAGVITANTLTTTSVTGLSLTGLNAAANFNATNTTSGNVAFTHTGALNITGITQNVGNLTITNTGAITQSGPMSVSGTSSFTAGAGAITLTNSSNNFVGAVTLSNTGLNDVNIFNNANLKLGASTIGQNLVATVSGANVINLNGNITTGVSQTYNNPVVLTANTVLTMSGAGVVNFASTVDGPFNLTITQPSLFTMTSNFNDLGNLNALTITNAALIQATGNTTKTTTTQTYGGAVTLDGLAAVTFQGSTITFNNALNTNVGGGTALTITGGLSLGAAGTIGQGSNISSLSVSGATTTASLSAVPYIVTTGNQTYTGAVNGTVAATQNFNINSSAGSISLGAVGTTTSLKNVTVSAANGIALNGSITTGANGVQTYNNAVLIGANLTLTASNTGGVLNFVSSLNDSALRTHALTLVASTFPTFSSTPGITTRFATLTISNPSVVVDSTLASFVVEQLNNGTSVGLTGNTTALTVSSPITQTNNPANVTLTLAAATTNAINSAITLISGGSFVASGTSGINLAANISTGSAQSYNNVVTLTGGPIALTSSAASIAFANTLTGNFDLTLNAATTVTVSTITGLASLVVTAPSGIIDTSTVLSVIGNLTLNNDITFPNSGTISTTGGGNISIQDALGTACGACNLSLTVSAGGGPATTLLLNKSLNSNNLILSSTGMTTLIGSALSARNAITVTGPITFTQNVSLTTRFSGVTFNGDVLGPGGISGNIAFNGGFGTHIIFGGRAGTVAKPLAFINLPSGDSGGYIQFLSSFDVVGAVTLIDNANFGSGAILFDGVGTTSHAASVSATAGGETNATTNNQFVGIRFSGVTIITTGNQAYSTNGQGGVVGGGLAILTGDTVLDATGSLGNTNGTVSFASNGFTAVGSAISSDNALTPRNLTIKGTASFGTLIGTGTGAALLNNLTISKNLSNVGGATTFTGNSTATNTVLNQVYSGAVTLGVTRTFTSASGNITFGTTAADAVNGGVGLTTSVINGQAVTFNGAVGASTALASVTTSATGTTNINGGSVRTSGLQNYQNPVILGATTTLSSTGGGTLGFKSIDSDGTPRGLTLTTTALTTLTGNIGAAISPAGILDFLTISGPVAIGSNVHTVHNQLYSGVATLIANPATPTLTTLTSDSGNITFNSTLNGGFNLATTANNVTFNGVVGGLTPLASLASTVPMAGSNFTIFNTTLVKTVGLQTYVGNVGVRNPTNPTTINFWSTSGGTISFNSALEGAGPSPTNLIGITITGNFLLTGPNGNLQTTGVTGLLNSLHVTGTSTFSNPNIFNGVNTLGSQSYDGPVRLDVDNVVFATQNAGGVITFGSTLQSNGGPWNVIVALSDATSILNFNGVVGGVGGSDPLNTLTILADPAATININTTEINTTGTQSYGSKVVIGGGVTAVLTSATAGMTFDSTVDALTTGGESLQLISPNTITLTGNIGSIHPLSILTIGSGAVATPATIAAASIITTNGQRYYGPVTITTNNKKFTSAAGTIEFDQGISGLSFGVNIDPAIVILAGTYNVASLTVAASSEIDLQQVTATTTSGETFTAPNIYLQIGDTSLTDSGSSIVFNGAIDGGFNLTASAVSGTVEFDGVVGGTTALSSLDATGAQININTGEINTTGNQYYHGPVMLLTDVNSPGIQSANGNITFGDVINGAQALIITANNGAVEFDNNIGSGAILTSLTVTAQNINLAQNINAITTDNNQNYIQSIIPGTLMFNPNVSETMTFTSNNGNIDFNIYVSDSQINSSVHTDVVVNASNGTAEFDAFFGIGNNCCSLVNPNSLTVNANLIEINNQSMSALNNVLFNGPVSSLLTTITSDNANVTFTSTIVPLLLNGGIFSVIANNGIVTFDDDIGALSNSFVGVQVQSPATIFNGQNVVTSDFQVWNTALTLTQPVVTLTNTYNGPVFGFDGGITFVSDVNGPSTALHVNGNLYVGVTFTPVASGTLTLQSLQVGDALNTSFATVYLQGHNINTSGNQDYYGPVFFEDQGLNIPVTLTGNNIHFHSIAATDTLAPWVIGEVGFTGNPVDVVISGNLISESDIGPQNITGTGGPLDGTNGTLNSLSVSGTSLFSGSIVTTYGNQIYSGVVTLANDLTTIALTTGYIQFGNELPFPTGGVQGAGFNLIALSNNAAYGSTGSGITGMVNVNSLTVGGPGGANLSLTFLSNPLAQSFVATQGAGQAIQLTTISTPNLRALGVVYCVNNFCGLIPVPPVPPINNIPNDIPPTQIFSIPTDLSCDATGCDNLEIIQAKNNCAYSDVQLIDGKEQVKRNILIKQEQDCACKADNKWMKYCKAPLRNIIVNPHKSAVGILTKAHKITFMPHYTLTDVLKSMVMMLK